MTFVDLYLVIFLVSAFLAYVIVAKRAQNWSTVVAFMIAGSPIFGTFAIVEKMTGLPFVQSMSADLPFTQLIVAIAIGTIPVVGMFWLAKMAIDALTQPRPVQKD
jgi:uncharacterized membrane protein